MRRLLTLLWMALALASPLAAGWWDDAWLDPAILDAHSLEGGSGFIHVPAPQSLPNGLLTAGIHRYRVKLGRGFPWGFEAGGQMELEGWKLDEIEKRNLLYARWTPLPPHRFGVGFSVGVESVGMEDLGLKNLGFLSNPLLEPLERAYAVAGGLVPKFDMFYWAAGYAAGRVREGAPFAALTFAPFAGLAVMAELEDHSFHTGIRLLLSTQIKLDLSLSRLELIRGDEPFANVLERNLRFGISYSETWP